MRNRKRKTEDGLFTEEQMKEGVRLVLEDGLTLRAAAIRQGLSYPTLYRYVKKQKLMAEPETSVKMTPNYACRKVFTDAQELSLANYLRQCSLMCYGVTPFECRRLAYEMAERNDLTGVPASWAVKKIAGKDWLFGFMNRHQNLSIRQPEGCSLSRATSFNQFNVKSFYDNLENIYQRNPEAFADGSQVWNLDETATTTVQKPGKVIATKGRKQVNQVTSGERGTLVTTCCFISASGNTIPPVMVFPRKNYSRAMIHGAPCGTLGLANPSGWMTSELFVETLQHFIVKTHCSKEKPTLLICDNHESHLSLAAIDLAKANGVIILTLPPHCSSRLQPLDVSVYAPFKRYYNSALDSWMLRHPAVPVKIYDISECVGVAFEKSMTPSNIHSGFKSTGIFPFDRNAFSDEDFLMSSVTDRPEKEKDASPSRNSEQQEEVLTPALPSEQPHCSKSLGPHETSSAKPSSEKAFVGASEIRGFPKAKERKSNRQNGRRKGRTCIPTDTPTRNEIADAKMKKTKPNVSRVKKPASLKTRKKLFIESDTDEDDPQPLVVSSEESDVEEGPTLEVLSKSKRLKEGNYVVVQFDPKGKIFYFVGKILSDIDSDGDYEISYLQRSRKVHDGFVVKDPPELCSVQRNDIKFILPKPVPFGKTKRQNGVLKFNVRFANIDIR